MHQLIGDEVKFAYHGIKKKHFLIASLQVHFQPKRPEFLNRIILKHHSIFAQVISLDLKCSVDANHKSSQ